LLGRIRTNPDDAEDVVEEEAGGGAEVETPTVEEEEPGAEAVADRCGTFGCTLPDQHIGLHRVANLPARRTTAGGQQAGQPSVPKPLMQRPAGHRASQPASEAMRDAATEEGEEEEEEDEADLCGTNGCTLRRLHVGLCKIPDLPPRRAAAAAGRERAAQHARQEASQQPGPSGQSSGEPEGAANDGSIHSGSGAEDEEVRPGRAPKKTVIRAFPFHLTMRGLWMREGLSAEESHRGPNAMVYGARLHFLLDKDPELAPGAMGTWKRGDAPLVGWAPGWEPINKQTVREDETSNERGHCNAISGRMCNMLSDDWCGIRDGARLPEADTPAGEYMSYSALIGVHNRGLGYCLRCPQVLKRRAEIKRPQVREDGEPYGQLGEVWSAERQENFLMHTKSNVLPRPICKYAAPAIASTSTAPN